MARGNAKPAPVRGTYTPKAGKKKNPKQPPAPNLAKRDAREAGFQQFISKTQLTVPGTKIVFDKATGQFVTKLVAVNVPFLYDETRKHLVYSPTMSEREDR